MLNCDMGAFELFAFAKDCTDCKIAMKGYYGLEDLKLGHRPMINLKHVLVIANNGSFRG